MAVPQRDDTIEAIKRLEPPSRVRCGVLGALLEYAVMHGDEAERIRDERTGGCVGFAEGRRSRGYRREDECDIISRQVQGEKMSTRKTKACKAAETLKKPAIWSAEAFGERCYEILPTVMRATFVALSLLTSNAHAWMDKWAPTFKFAPAKYRKLPERSVGAFVEDSEEYGRPVKYCEGAVLDLNDDGVDDYVFIIPWMGNGLNASGYWVRFIVSDGAKGRKETMVECYGAELSDLVKVGEKTYFRQSNFFSKFEKSEHNHWVYQMFSFDKDGVMKCANDEVGRPFPAATIFYDKPKFKAIELTAADLKQIEKGTRPTSRKYVP